MLVHCPGSAMQMIAWNGAWWPFDILYIPDLVALCETEHSWSLDARALSWFDPLGERDCAMYQQQQ